MTLLRSRRRPATSPGTELAAAATALRSALESGGDRLEPRAVARARDLVTKIDERTAITGGHTVVALAGATGSGKSSLFNQIVGADVAAIGARRPTTSTPTAAVWGAEPAGRLLDWLAVGSRHHVELPPESDPIGAEPEAAPDAEPRAEPGAVSGADRSRRYDLATDGTRDPMLLDGLVLLDLPDVDSRLLEHRVEADRVLELVDVFVWVTDPQKYADALLHEGYIARLAGHDATTLVVLNQADRLTDEAVAACRTDLTQLLERSGLRGAEVVVTSARTGSGVVDLRHRISAAVATRTAAEQRLLADVRALVTELRRGVADREPVVDAAPDGPLVDALSRAAGIPAVLDAVERNYRREALGHTGWPFTRWARSLRPDPLRRLRLGSRTPSADDTAEGLGGLSAADVLAVLGRSSLPPPSPAARSAVRLASLDVADRAAAGLPQRWADACLQAAAPSSSDLNDALDQAVVHTSLRGREPRWWSVFGALHWLFAAAAVAGLLWLVVLGVIGWLRLPEVPTPTLGALPYPFLLFAGGLLAGAFLTLVARPLRRAGARRRRTEVSARLSATIAGVARTHIVAPVQAVLEAHRATRELLEGALSRR